MNRCVLQKQFSITEINTFLTYSIIMSEHNTKFGIVLYSDDPEIAWNAFRFANFSVAMNDDVKVFLLNKGVYLNNIENPKFDVRTQVKEYLAGGGKIWACGTCLDKHDIKDRQNYITSTLKDLYEIIKDSEKVLTF
jgi:sulfur relay (sulfurtransferase) complex TusBCD TusD component (DsrE family)